MWCAHVLFSNQNNNNMDKIDNNNFVIIIECDTLAFICLLIINIVKLQEDIYCSKQISLYLHTHVSTSQYVVVCPKKNKKM